MSVFLVVIRNPFNPSERDLLPVEHIQAKTIAGYLADVAGRIENNEIVVSVNGGIVPPENWDCTTVAAGAYIAVCPVIGKGDDGKSILGTIAGIALSVYSGNIANGLWTGGVGVAGSVGFASYLAATAVMFVGGMLINSLTPQPKIDTSNVDTSATYSWDKTSSINRQGNPVGITYGTVQPTPQLLSSHISGYETNSYLNLLLCGGDGPIDAITDVRIDDNPTSNYDDVQVDLRLGTNDQAAIPNFGENFADQDLNYEVTSDWAVQRLDGNGYYAFEVAVQFPNGLYYLDGSGNAQVTHVWIDVDYREVGDESWIPMVSNLDCWAGRTDSVRYSLRCDHASLGIQINPLKQYEVRMRCRDRSGTSNRYINRFYWIQLSGITYAGFCHPGKALVGIRALATSQLSGSMPTITWKQTRSQVLVCSDAGYVWKAATNPAWAAYDLIHRCKLLKDIRDGLAKMVVFGAPVGRLIYQDFAAWADYCDRHNLTVNIFIDSANDLWTALKDIESCGRGKVLTRGTRFGCVYDGDKTIVQMFSMGNIVAGTFKETFMSTKDRANAVEVTFNNKDRNYERDTVIVYSDDYDSSDVIKNPTQITMNGIVTWDQAYREAKYRLRVNQYMLRSVSFDAAVDAIACQVGDAILVQHDVPQWGFGGRCVGEMDASTVRLDQKVTLEPGKTYEIMIRFSETDAMEKRMVSPVAEATTTDTLAVMSPFAAVPTEFDDVYTFGEAGLYAKPFVVTAITRSADQVRTITAVEYVEGIYTEATTIPQINYSALNSKVNITSGSLSQATYRQRDGTIVSNVYASWTIPRGRKASKFDVYVSTDGQNWSYYASTTDTSMVMSGAHSQTTYWVKVYAKNEAGIYGDPAWDSIYVTGRDMPPPNVTGLVVSVDPADRTRAVLTWGTVEAPDLRGYRVSFEGQSIETATNQAIVTATTANMAVSVVAVDNSGNLSETAATIAAPTVPYPSQVAGFTVVPEPTDRTVLDLSWSPATDSDLALYEVRSGASWAAGTVVGRVQANRLTYRVPETGSYTFWIAAQNAANRYGAPVSVTLQASCEPSDVATFVACQNGNNVLLSWEQVSDTDVSRYEIREGGSFSGGALVATNVTGTSYQVPVDTEAQHRYHVKAINNAGYYSANAASASVSVTNLAPRNVIFSYNEMQLRSGTANNTVFGSSSITFNSVSGKFSDYSQVRFNELGNPKTTTFANLPGRFSDYANTRFADVDGAALKLASAAMSGTYESAVRDMGQIITANISCEFLASVLITTGTSANLEYCLSNDGNVWSAWVPFYPIQATFKCIKTRVVLSTVDASKTPEVLRWILRIDVPDTDRYGTATVGEGGSSVVYGHTYWSNPYVAPMATESGKRAEIVSIGTAAFTVRVLNGLTGADVGGTITWHSRGY